MSNDYFEEFNWWDEDGLSRTPPLLDEALLWVLNGGIIIIIYIKKKAKNLITHMNI
jgi:hypothetical protein